MVFHLEYLVAERERGDISSDKGDMAQTAGRTIRDRDDSRRWAEEVYQQLMVKVELFYVDDGMVASTDPGWLQSAFDTLTGIFDRVGLRANVHKTVGMVCRPFRAAGCMQKRATPGG